MSASGPRCVPVERHRTTTWVSRPVVPGEGCWENIRLPDRLRIEPLDERLDVVRVPGREAVLGDVDVVLSCHRVPPCVPKRYFRCAIATPPSAPAGRAHFAQHSQCSQCALAAARFQLIRRPLDEGLLFPLRTR